MVKIEYECTYKMYIKNLLKNLLTPPPPWFLQGDRQNVYQKCIKKFAYSPPWFWQGANNLAGWGQQSGRGADKIYTKNVLKNLPTPPHDSDRGPTIWQGGRQNLYQKCIKKFAYSPPWFWQGGRQNVLKNLPTPPHDSGRGTDKMY